MRQLSPAGQETLSDIARRHGFSLDATRSMLDAVINGNGSMAQFNHPEFSGSGQWMRGGMTMVSDMFNNYLKGRVDALCSELSNLVYQSGDSLFLPQPHGMPGASGDWWPADLRWPNSTGAQNNVRYAYFAQAHRLVIDLGGNVTVYDTLDHQIGGFSQAQSVGGTLGFSSQYGLIDVSSLPVVSVNGAPVWAPAPTPAQTFNTASVSYPQDLAPPVFQNPSSSSQDVFATIEKLADLRAKGILSDDEFATKKAELLSRL